MWNSRAERGLLNSHSIVETRGPRFAFSSFLRGAPLFASLRHQRCSRLFGCRLVDERAHSTLLASSLVATSGTAQSLRVVDLPANSALHKRQNIAGGSLLHHEEGKNYEWFSWLKLGCSTPRSALVCVPWASKSPDSECGRSSPNRPSGRDALGPRCGVRGNAAWPPSGRHGHGQLRDAVPVFRLPLVRAHAFGQGECSFSK